MFAKLLGGHVKVEKFDFYRRRFHNIIIPYEKKRVKSDTSAYKEKMTQAKKFSLLRYSV